MKASDVTQKIKDLTDIYGDLDILINVQGSETPYFKNITSVELQEGLQGEDESFIDERVILLTCES